MYLVQVFLPQYDNDHRPLPHELYEDVRTELTERFGGLTAYTRAPAEGRWKEDGDRTSYDDIVIFEVMAEDLDRACWTNYRRNLEERFRQQQVVVRAQQIELL